MSNLLALVIAGVLTYTVLGYTTEALNARPFARRRPYVVLTVMLVLVALPLAGQSIATYLVSHWTSEVKSTTAAWLSNDQGAVVSSVEIDGRTVHIFVRNTRPLPDTASLMTDLSAILPHGLQVVLDSTVGQEQSLGQVS